MPIVAPYPLRKNRAWPARWAALTLVAGGLSSCGTAAGSGLEPLIGPLSGSLLASDFAVGLSERERRMAAETEYKALETGQAGLPVEWQASENVFGKVVPQQPYRVGARDCRRYIHTLVVDGDQRTATGTACRDTDGIWQPLT